MSSPKSNLHKHSCVRCHKRKVKCDRSEPCGYCRRHDDECRYEDPAPPRKRKRPLDVTEESTARLQNGEMQVHLTEATTGSYRDMLTRPLQLSMNSPAVDDDERSRSMAPAAIAAASNNAVQRNGIRSEALRSVSSDEHRQRGINHGGRLIADRGNTRYLENNMWVHLDDQLHNSRQLLQDDSGPNNAEDKDDDSGFSTFDAGDMLLSTGPINGLALDNLLPSSAQSPILWQIYLSRVHPLIKIIHAPTFQEVVESSVLSIHDVPNSTLALLFSVYAFAISVMTATECQENLGVSRSGLLRRLQYGTRLALVKASFLRSSDLATLQAFISFLLFMRNSFDAATLWTLSGVAFRIAQRIGLHQDTANALTPFEGEMRRRVWRQLIILDHVSAELAGSAPTYSVMVIQHWSSKLPLNVNDSDLRPDMTELPPEREGATEMMFCALRNEFSTFFLHACRDSPNADGTAWNPVLSNDKPLSEKDKCIDELNQTLEQKFLRFCDPLIPLHNLTSIACRMALCSLRLRIHHPRQYPDGGASLAQSEKDLLFSLSMKAMQYDSLLYSNERLACYHWHIRVHFQWHAFIYLLSELRLRPIGDKIDQAWDQVVDTFHHHPELMNNNRNALYKAIRAIVLRAWESREFEFQHRRTPLYAPDFILKLRGDQSNSSAHSHDLSLDPTSAASKSRESETTAPSQQPIPYSMALSGLANNDNRLLSQETSLPQNTVPSPVDWEQWENLLRSIDLPAVDMSLDAIFK